MLQCSQHMKHQHLQTKEPHNKKQSMYQRNGYDHCTTMVITTPLIYLMKPKLNYVKQLTLYCINLPDLTI